MAIFPQPNASERTAAPASAGPLRCVLAPGGPGLEAFLTTCPWVRVLAVVHDTNALRLHVACGGDAVILSRDFDRWRLPVGGRGPLAEGRERVGSRVAGAAADVLGWLPPDWGALVLLGGPGYAAALGRGAARRPRTAVLAGARVDGRAVERSLRALAREAAGAGTATGPPGSPAAGTRTPHRPQR